MISAPYLRQLRPKIKIPNSNLLTLFAKKFKTARIWLGDRGGQGACTQITFRHKGALLLTAAASDRLRIRRGPMSSSKVDLDSNLLNPNHELF